MYIVVKTLAWAVVQVYYCKHNNSSFSHAVLQEDIWTWVVGRILDLEDKREYQQMLSKWIVLSGSRCDYISWRRCDIDEFPLCDARTMLHVHLVHVVATISHYIHYTDIHDC